MKRSEMVLAIASELVREMTGFIVFDDAQELAESIIKLIEDHMRPIHPGGDLAGILEDGEWEPETPKMVVLVGNIGSGKTTWASQQVGYEIVNQDLLGSRDKCIKVTKQYIKDGKSVIIDRTNISKKQRANWVNIAREFNIPIECIEFRIDPEFAIDRVFSRRGHPTIKSNTPIEKITSIIKGFASEYEEPVRSEGFSNITVINVNK